MKKFSDLRDEILGNAAARQTYESCLQRFRASASLGELRRARLLTQEQLARSMDTAQSAISRIEHQADLYVRTLRSYVEAMGGELEISAVFPEARVLITAFAEISPDPPTESESPPVVDLLSALREAIEASTESLTGRPKPQTADEGVGS
jgi:transcriptional regulator with XRE-family HTH domain